MQVTYSDKTIFFECAVVYTQDVGSGTFRVSSERWNFTLWNNTAEYYSNEAVVPDGYFSFSQCLNAAIAKVAGDLQASFTLSQPMTPAEPFPIFT